MTGKSVRGTGKGISTARLGGPKKDLVGSTDIDLVFRTWQNTLD